MPNATDVIACQLWRGLPSIVENIAKKSKGISSPGQHVILIDIENHLPALVAVLTALGDLHYNYTILAEEMSWHEGVNIPQNSYSS
jgi:hypothetical protein